MTAPTVRPFLKWAGGKTQLLDAFTGRVPGELKTGALPVFVEPFLGGGAVYFHFNSIFRFRECHLFDINEELVLAYNVVKNDVSGLIRYLSEISNEFLSENDAGRKEYYYRMREAFNRARGETDFRRYDSGWIERAGQFIFLNRTCFNGLYRVNSRGGFNVPFGRYRNPKILRADLLRADSAALRNTTVHLGDFTQSEPYVSEDAFVYFDPPYRPLNRTSSFTQYSKTGFTDEDQKRLAAFYARCDARGARLMLSNSDPKNSEPGDGFFDELYADYHIDRIPAKRMINCDGRKRGEICEIIVTNYDPQNSGEG
ncbi:MULTISPECIES: DNA adenine methylase [unclassified Methanoculleus]|jgi:DNA adenine methylase|uniref:site-specific DNA-methyltransferase (adenine-specific) n=1 Tax=Methanoculleus palmolei TaxID=72612 RepID=A0ABD8A6N5_9EURY|nr:DNA adenine methylase [Methanoculleus sp. UBA377]MDD2473213.1 DNA adenine methylase [Methanoculleus sp.]WOX55210.1 DNA adenine methylase [Methanoculleus palmolei]